MVLVSHSSENKKTRKSTSNIRLKLLSNTSKRQRCELLVSSNLPLEKTAKKAASQTQCRCHFGKKGKLTATAGASRE